MLNLNKNKILTKQLMNTLMALNNAEHPTGYFAKATKPGNGKGHIQNAYDKNLMNFYKHIDRRKHNWFLANPVKGMRRKNTDVIKFLCNTIDIDCVENGISIKKCLNELKSNKSLPQPTAIQISGHGLYLWFIYNKPVKANTKNNQDWHKAEKILVKYLNAYFKQQFGKCLADSHSTNSARLFRMPNSLNVKYLNPKSSYTKPALSYIYSFNPKERYDFNNLVSLTNQMSNKIRTTPRSNNTRNHKKASRSYNHDSNHNYIPHNSQKIFKTRVGMLLDNVAVIHRQTNLQKLASELIKYGCNQHSLDIILRYTGKKLNKNVSENYCHNILTKIKVNMTLPSKAIHKLNQAVNGFKHGTRHSNLLSICSTFMKAGTNPYAVLDLANFINSKSQPPMSNQDVTIIVNESMGYELGTNISDSTFDTEAAHEIINNTMKRPYFIRNRDGDIRSNFLINIVNAIQCSPFNNLLKFNQFVNAPFIFNKDKHNWQQLNDADVSMMRAFIEEHYLFAPSNNTLMNQAVNLNAKKNAFNPIKDIINARKWDGKHRVATLLSDYLGALDNHYTRMVASRFLCGAVARAFHPGCKFELMPILVGKQGIGKTTLIEKLFGKYEISNLKNMNSQDKETVFRMMSGWGIEISELAAMRNTKIDEIKTFLSTRVYRYRDLYHHRDSIYKTHNVCIGTTNNGDILKDRTGNRRFLPVHCHLNKSKYNIHTISRETILQIWAEAKVLLEKYGNSILYINSKENAKIDKIRKDYQAYSPVATEIRSFLKAPVPKNWHSLPLNQKRYYYNNYYYYGKTVVPNGHHFKENELTHLKSTTTLELIEIALDEENDKAVRLERSHIGRKVNSTMRELGDWIKIRACIHGRRVIMFKKVK